MKIAILQMNSIIGNVQENCKKVRNLVDSELGNSVDVLVLPEVWSVGWECREFIRSAEYFDFAIDTLRQIALKYNTNIIGGSVIQKRDGDFYNTCPVIDKNGNIIAQYDKNHLYSYYGCDEGKYITKGNSPLMVEIENVRFGLTICYDIRFPEIYRAYRKCGADVLINCAAWGATKPIAWDVMTKSRAVENQCYMIALTQCGKINDREKNLGESSIISYNGQELAHISQTEGIVSSEILLDEMYDFRSKCTILDDIKQNYEVKFLCKK